MVCVEELCKCYSLDSLTEKSHESSSGAGALMCHLCSSIRQQASGRPVGGACTQSGGHCPTTRGDQLAARSDCGPAGPLQRGECHTMAVIDVTEDLLKYIHVLYVSKIF